MDMKKILQALDGAANAPVQGADDMKKFVSIIKEGANPHKVALPVQMAMQHYQKPAEKPKSRPALVDKYFMQVEAEQLQEKQEKRQLINQYAQTIAERVLMKESYVPWNSKERSPATLEKIRKAKEREAKNTVPGQLKRKEVPSRRKQNVQRNMDFVNKLDTETGYAESMHNAPDAVTMDIPLLVRMLEYAREDAQTDIEIHDVVERMIHMSEEGRTLSMDDYNEICNIGQHQLQELSNEKLGQYKKAAGAAASAADKAGDYETGNKRFKGIVKATVKQGENDLKKTPKK